MIAATHWKNGDLALVTCSDGNERRALYYQHAGGYGIWRFRDGSVRRVSESQARRLVAIELPYGALAGWPVLIDLLEQAKDATGYQMTFDGLIEQVKAQTEPPKPPKPDEPTGWGAVVEDDTGAYWTLYAPEAGIWINYREGKRRWHEITAVRTVSEGVSP